MVRFGILVVLCSVWLGACAPAGTFAPGAAPPPPAVVAAEPTVVPATTAPIIAPTKILPTKPAPNGASGATTTSNQYLAFASDRDNEPGIYLLALDTLKTQRITTEALDASHPAWSPDGASIAFDARVGGREELFVMRADGSELRQLTHAMGDNFYPSWSPDSQSLAVASNREGPYQIFIMRADGSEPKRISDGESRAEKPAWSPDGKEIAYMLQRNGNVDIYVTDVNGQETRRLTTNPGSDFNPAWSPDGSRIAFNSSRAGQHQIFLMRADGSKVRQLTHARGWSEKPAWSPDGKQIAFYSNRDGNPEVYVMDVPLVDSDAGTAQETAVRLTNSAGFDGQPTWAVQKKSAQAECPITQPPSPAFVPPDPKLASAPYGGFWYETAGLWTLLYPDGVWEQLPAQESGYTQKTFWMSKGYNNAKEQIPDIKVSGRRLDADAPPLKTWQPTNGFHADFGSFMLVGVEIPTTGCWEITGVRGDSTLRYVVEVR